MTDAHHDRRRFLGFAIPTCAGCLAMRALPSLAQEKPAAAQPAPAPAAPAHKFDAELPAKMTYRDLFRARFGAEFLTLAKFLTRTLGAERSQELLKGFATEQGTAWAKGIAAREGSDFAVLRKLFSLDNQSYRHTLTMRVVESTDSAHEIEVTECLWATACLDARAGAEGYAAICFGDHAFAPAFNPRVELLRSKTLMQGHDRCNHRWVVKA